MFTNRLLLAAFFVALLGVVVMVPAAQAGGPGSYYSPGYSPYPVYTNPNPYFNSYPVYTYPRTYSYSPPVVNQYAYRYTSPAPIFVNPGRSYFPYSPSQSYIPSQSYYPSYGGWGSFGTYDNWARQFYSEHGRRPNSSDERDFWWSQGFAARHGFSPY